MEKLKVVSLDAYSIMFDNGYELSSEHEQDCCEHHWLSFDDLTMEDFEGLEFDLSSDNFFECVEGYGIRLVPIKGHPVSVPGYGSNNGYYSSNLDLIVSLNGKMVKGYDVSDCQEIRD